MNEMSSEYMLITLDDELPEMPEFEPGIRRAPSRGFHLTEEQTKTALKNALRYIKPEYHKQLIPEFLDELYTKGRIYGYRFRPAGTISMESRLTEYKGKMYRGKSISGHDR